MIALLMANYLVKSSGNSQGHSAIFTNSFNLKANIVRARIHLKVIHY